MVIYNLTVYYQAYVNIDKVKIQRKLKVHEILLDILVSFTTKFIIGLLV
jgi:hypothetical protein